jgi:hypothetical protein
LEKIKNITSKKQLSNMSDAVNNPFDAVISMFDAVPLVKLHTRDVNLKIPMVYSEDVENYVNYLNTWLGTQMKILRRWIYALSDVFALCGTISQEEARSTLIDLEQEKKDIQADKTDSKLQTKLLESLENERKALQEILDNKNAIASNAAVKNCLDKK